MDEMEFTEAESNLYDMISDYDSCGGYSDPYEYMSEEDDIYD